MKRTMCMLGILVLVVTLLTQTMKWYEQKRMFAIAPIKVGEISSLILDAGHGGADGGAVSPTGAVESQINLAIVQKLNDLFGFYGVCPIVLRLDDKSLHEDTAVTAREKKVSDLKNRVAMVQQAPDATLLSIHQNSYPEGQYFGAQAFYAPTNGSQALAQHIQAAIRDALQPENHRQAKEIPDTVYLMNHIDNRAVLLECGFLTNPREDQLLQDDFYQKKLAVSVVSAWMTAPPA